MAERRCRECGCTEDRACIWLGTDFGGPPFGGDPPVCGWIADDLCTACAPGHAEGWLHPDEQEAVA